MEEFFWVRGVDTAFLGRRLRLTGTCWPLSLHIHVYRYIYHIYIYTCTSIGIYSARRLAARIGNWESACLVQGVGWSRWRVPGLHCRSAAGGDQGQKSPGCGGRRPKLTALGSVVQSDPQPRAALRPARGGFAPPVCLGVIELICQ